MTSLPEVDTINKEIRELDMNIALSIAGFSGMPTRDRHGNIVGEIWTKCNDIDSAAAKLLDYTDMRTMLKEQLRNHLEARKDLLLASDSHDIVAKWIFNFSEAWEKEYQNRTHHGWDISQVIFTAMEEAMYEVKEILNEVYPVSARPDQVQATIQSIIDAKPHHSIYQDAYHATVRLFFRNKFTGPMMIHIAGKKLQKQIVCNRSGAYSARVQRNDVQQEVDSAVDNLYHAVMDDHVLFRQFAELVQEMLHKSTSFDKNDLKWILDHTQTATLTTS